MRIIAISGGIGSGKSVVSRMVSVMGWRVYDCDSRARRLMDTSDEIKRRIASEISDSCITQDNEIDRQCLSGLVFNDAMALDVLNKIVHGAEKISRIGVTGMQMMGCCLSRLPSSIRAVWIPW